MADRWPRHLRNSNSQASAYIPFYDAIRNSREWKINMEYNKKTLTGNPSGSSFVPSICPTRSFTRLCCTVILNIVPRVVQSEIKTINRLSPPCVLWFLILTHASVCVLFIKNLTPCLRKPV